MSKLSRREFLQLMALLGGGAFLSACDLLTRKVSPEETMTTEFPHSFSPELSALWYDRPAQYWVEALPLGNGRLGTMVFGGTGVDHLQFNEESLWSGFPRDHTNPTAKAYLAELRKAVFEGNYTLADMMAKRMQGPYTESYLPLGDLYLEFDHAAEPQEYRRWLDLE